MTVTSRSHLSSVDSKPPKRQGVFLGWRLPHQPLGEPKIGWKREQPVRQSSSPFPGRRQATEAHSMSSTGGGCLVTRRTEAPRQREQPTRRSRHLPWSTPSRRSERGVFRGWLLPDRPSANRGTGGSEQPARRKLSPLHGQLRSARAILASSAGGGCLVPRRTEFPRQREQPTCQSPSPPLVDSVPPKRTRRLPRSAASCPFPGEPEIGRKREQPTCR
jgi:hypothetical protein